MSKEISSLSIALTSTVVPFANGLKTAEQAIGGFVGRVESMGSSLLRMTGIAGMASLAIGAVFSGGKAFQMASEFETAEVKLEALTGSANNAKAELAQLRDFAKSGPFEFPELLQSATRLQAVGVRADQVVPLLKEMGAVAFGTGNDMGTMVEMLARVSATGKLSERELREIPALTIQLGKQFKTSAEGVRQLAESGRIGLPQLRTAFDQMAGRGGQFANVLAAQSDTIGGAWKNLRGTMDDQLANIGESISKAFNLPALLGELSTFVDRAGTIISNLVDMAAPYIKQFAGMISSAMDFSAGRTRAFAQDAVGFLAIVGSAFGRLGSIVDYLGAQLAILDAHVASFLGDSSADAMAAHYQEIADKAAAVLTQPFDEVAANAMKKFDTFVDGLLKDSPKLKFDASVDSNPLKANIQPVQQPVQLPPLVMTGSAASQAYFYDQQRAKLGLSAVPLPNIQAGAAGPLAAPLNVQGGNANNVADAVQSAQLGELKTANQWLYKIEANTRGSGQGTPVVSLN